MDANKRKLVIMDLVLALIVLALFGLAPLTFHSRNADPDLIQGGSDVGSGNDVGISRIPSSRKPLLQRVSMEMTDFVSEIPINSGSGAISNP